MERHHLAPLVTSNSNDDYPWMMLTPGTPGTPDAHSKLRKPLPSPHHGRSVSAQHLHSPYASPQSSPRNSFQIDSGSGLANPIAPPAVFRGDLHPHSRSSSMDMNRSRPGTPNSYSRPTTPTISIPSQPSSRPDTPDSSRDKRKSGFLQKHRKDHHEHALPLAWIAGHPHKQPYDVTSLLNGRPVSELWDNDEGNCYVYLFGRNSGKGPSFKIDSAVFASSPVLTRLAFGDVFGSAAFQNGGDRRSVPLDARVQDLSFWDPTTPPRSPRQQRAYGINTSPTSSHSQHSYSSRGHLSNASDLPSETHLYLTIKLQRPEAMQTPPPSRDGADDSSMQDLQTLVDIRNFFAFLCGQSLIATEKKGNFFHIFMTIAGILKTYEFSNLDGSTFGEVASGSFDNYVGELGLADVRSSREKTIEGIVLGERMKSVFLYNEAFTHAAGKYEDIVNLKSPKFSLLSSVTDNRLIRAAMDLDKRLASAQLIFNDFYFPGLWSGITNSRTALERKAGVRFESWKEAFFGFRKTYITMLKHRYGDWPPKAKSKKNSLETSGLSRVVLRGMYHDMCSVYDLLVDRHSLTSRTVDGTDPDADREEPTVRGLRAVLSEYDRSSPPVKPPVPFDLPILPNIRSLRPNFGRDSKKDLALLQKKLKDDEISQILLQSLNKDTLANSSPFLQAFWEMEKKAAHNCTMSELVDLRIGQWIFMYVVLQALPMLARDAPGLKWTKGVEYFLCEPPRKGVPWANPNAPTPTGGITSAGPVGRTWFSVGEGANVVSLPADVVEHGVEGIYRRSHCWVMAEKWTSMNPIMNSALHEQVAQNVAAEEAARQERKQWKHRSRPVSTFYPQPLDLSPSASNYDLVPPDAPGSRTSRRHSSLTLGLEALPLPMGVTPDGSTPTGYASPDGRSSESRPRSAISADKSKTFDAILAGVGNEPKKGKKK